MKYVRLLRLQDQYVAVATGFAAGIYLKTHASWVVIWTISLILLSISAMILNELTDRYDTDLYSWNPVHVKESVSWQSAWGMIMIFSITGLFLAWKVQLFAWAFASWLLGIGYSLEPVRIKKRFALDLLVQIGAAWIIPVVGPIWKAGFFSEAIGAIVSSGCMMIALVMPYQLADLDGDQKAGFRNTHVVLGVSNYLYLTIVIAILGISGFLLNRGYIGFPWMLAIMVMNIYMVIRSIQWLRFNTYTQIRQNLIAYVRFIKPLSQYLMPMVILIWWLW